jgi:hypothetical protein
MDGWTSFLALSPVDWFGEKQEKERENKQGMR